MEEHVSPQDENGQLVDDFLDLVLAMCSQSRSRKDTAAKEECEGVVRFGVVEEASRVAMT